MRGQSRYAGTVTDQSNVLIVVPCLNEAANLPRLLSQLVAENPLATIIVADGGSSDESREIVTAAARREARVHLLDNPQRIQSAGINRAVECFGADHHWLVRIDAHCHYPEGFVARLLDAANRHGATSVVVPMLTRGEGCFQRAAAAAQNSRLGTGGAAHRHGGSGRFVDHGHHALFDLAAFVAVGGYDPGFSHNEDAELDIRLQRAGARIWLEPGASIVYSPRSRPGALFRQYFNYGKGRARTVAKHGLRLKLRQVLPLLVAPAIALGVAGVALAPLHPAFEWLMVPALGWSGLCLGYGAWLGVLGGSACMAMAGVAAMIMHLGWSLGYWRMRLTRSMLAQGHSKRPS